MSQKKISARIGEYQKEGKTVGKYAEVGVIIEKDGKNFILLDPSISLAGLLAKQNKQEWDKQGAMRDMVMCGIYDNSTD